MAFSAHATRSPGFAANVLVRLLPVSTPRGRWPWFAAVVVVGIALFVVLVWLLFLGFGFNV